MSAIKGTLLANAILLRGLIEDDNVPNTHRGLCYNLTYAGPTLGLSGVKLPYCEAVGELERIWKDWPEYSGDKSYPVPGGETAFYRSDEDGTMYVGEYGEARVRLLQFIIDTLTKELTNVAE